MKIAYCFHGCVGGLTGKNYEKKAGKEEVLEVSHRLLKKNIDISNIDFFIHSWDEDLKQKFIDYYNPKKIILEPQVVFNPPKHLPNNDRVQAHYSRWYSATKVIDLKNQYEKETNSKYDLIILTRHDLCWLRKYDLNKLNPNVFNFDAQHVDAGSNYYSKTSKELGDVCISTNSKYMDLLVDIYNKLDEYTKPGQCEQYKHISSHFCLAWHLKKLNLRDQIEFPYIKYEPADRHVDRIDNSDISIVRYVHGKI